MKILLTGFDPFGGESVNPAWEAVKSIEPSPDITILQVPTVYYESVMTVTERIEKLQPDSVILVGQAGGRACITAERTAINFMQSNICDNGGNRLTGRIYENSPDAFFSTLNNEKIISALAQAGIPAKISDSAGTFVCNHLLYGVLRFIRERGMHCRCGFIHVPFIPAQTVSRPDTPSMSLEMTVAALNIITQIQR